MRAAGVAYSVAAACDLLAAEGRRLECRFVGDVAAEREEVAGAAALVVPRGLCPDGSRECLPTVMLEAMALGTPCVAHDVGAIREVLLHGHTGLVMAAGDPAGLAQSLGARSC